MAARVDIPRPILETFAELSKSRPDLTNSEIGTIMRDDFPKHFNPATRPGHIFIQLQRLCRDDGIDLPYRKPGFKDNGVAPPANTRYAEEYPELIFPFESNLIVISDAHAGVHYRRGIELACRTIEAKQIPCVVINGDFLDMGYKGHKGHRDVVETHFEECIAAGAHFIDLMIAAGARRFVVDQGNHDDKPLRDSDQEILYDEFWTAKLLPHVERAHDATFMVTNRYYAIMEPRNPRAWRPSGFTCDDFPTVFEHQKNYAKVQLSTPSELCDIYEANIVCGHAHHLALGQNKSGTKHAVEAGTFADPELIKYKTNRHSRHPKWGRGFVTLHHGVPQRWRFADPDDWWEAALA